MLDSDVRSGYKKAESEVCESFDMIDKWRHFCTYRLLAQYILINPRLVSAATKTGASGTFDDHMCKDFTMYIYII